MNDLDLLFPKAENRPFTVREAISGASTNGLDGKFLLLEGKTSEYIKLLEPGQRLEQLYSEMNPGKRAYFAFSKTHPDRPCRTIAKDSAGLFHYSENRTLSIGEYKRVASFPDEFIFTTSFNAALMRIGNSVPPLFMRSIARQIKYAMFSGDEPEKQNRMNKYLTILEAAWQDHLKEREENAPTVISTFAGAGGSSLGYSMAGYRELLAVEWDDNAVETFNLNFPGVPVYHGDIVKLTVDQALQMTGLQPGELDVLDGSPPCQGFSTAGKRDMGDERNQLFREYVRLLRGLKPKVFVMENVSGMVKGKMKLIFAEILRELKASGYRVSARLLNAMYFNVPQSRERMIFIGVREDLGIEPSHPKAENKPFTVRDAWQGIEDEHGDKLTGPAALIAPYVPPGGNNGGGKYSLKIRGTTSGFGFSRLAWNKPCCTIPKETLLSSSPIVHPDRDERITISQAKRCASLPDPFQMIGEFEKQWERIGNSVPPLLMRSIARHVRQEILDKVPVNLS